MELNRRETAALHNILENMKLFESIGGVAGKRDVNKTKSFFRKQLVEDLTKLLCNNENIADGVKTDIDYDDVNKQIEIYDTFLEQYGLKRGEGGFNSKLEELEEKLKSIHKRNTQVNRESPGSNADVETNNATNQQGIIGNSTSNERATNIAMRYLNAGGNPEDFLELKDWLSKHENINLDKDSTTDNTP